MTETVGAYLKRLREEKQISIDDIVKETKIQKRYIEDIEENNFKELPGETYVKGFLKNYASVIGISSSEIIELYEEYLNENKEENIFEEVEEKNSKNLLIYIFLIIFFIFIIYQLITKVFNKAENKVEVKSIILNNKIENKNSENTINLKEEENKKNKIQNENTEQKKENNESKKEEKFEEIKTLEVNDKIVNNVKLAEFNKLKITALNGNSWIWVKDGKKTVFKGILKNGNFREIESKNEIWVRVGDGNKISFTYNGKEEGILGEEGKPFNRIWK